jgi:hypothetical protein
MPHLYIATDSLCISELRAVLMALPNCVSGTAHEQLMWCTMPLCSGPLAQCYTKVGVTSWMDLQWGNIMESVGASDRVMEILDKPDAPQISEGLKLPEFRGNVSTLLCLYPISSSCNRLVL